MKYAKKPSRENSEKCAALRIKCSETVIFPSPAIKSAHFCTASRTFPLAALLIAAVAREFEKIHIKYANVTIVAAARSMMIFRFSDFFAILSVHFKNFLHAARRASFHGTIRYDILCDFFDFMPFFGVSRALHRVFRRLQIGRAIARIMTIGSHAMHEMMPERGEHETFCFFIIKRRSVYLQ